MRILLVVLTAILIFSFAMADEYEISPIACDKAKTRAELMICLDIEVSDLDAVNNRVYNNLMTELDKRYKAKDPKRLQNLKAAINKSTLAWIDHRDAACELETIHLDDEAEKSDFYKQCLMTMLRNRIEELRIVQITLKDLTFQTAPRK